MSWADWQTPFIRRISREFEQVVSEILAFLKSQSNDQLYQIKRYEWCGEKWPLGRWISINTSSPYRSGLAKIRRWKRKEVTEG